MSSAMERLLRKPPVLTLATLASAYSSMPSLTIFRAEEAAVGVDRLQAHRKTLD